MPVPVRIYATSRPRQLHWLVLLVLLVAAPLCARGAGPPLRIPLDSLGFQPQAAPFLAAGSSMMTVNYVDNRHLLFTFVVHRLMERIANDPPDDQDRMVEAVLLEAPSGHVLARTTWRLHDNSQYLWDLGHGRFMLRVHDTLTTFAPMANLASGLPFRQRAFLTTDRRIGDLLLSPESDLLVIESVERTPPVPPPPTPLFGPAPKPAPPQLGRPGDPSPVALSFYRLALSGDGDEVKATLAGVAHASHFGDIAAIGVGHLEVVDEGRQKWAFDFHPYNGKVKELAPFGSTCDPMPRFVSNSEFIAFGCHGGNTPQLLGGFNMRGEEMWEQNLFGNYVGTYMTFSPESGRFALGRVLGEGATADMQPVAASAYAGQNVIVYQMESGKQLLHVDCSPISRAGQNFALSPDGMNFAVIHEDALEIYSLPPLSAADQAGVKEARTMVPQEDTLPIEFTKPSSASAATSPVPSEAEGAKSASTTASAPTTPSDVPQPASAPAIPAPIATPQPAPSTVGDAPPDQPRKPPTLYTLPGETAGNAAGSEAK